VNHQNLSRFVTDCILQDAADRGRFRAISAATSEPHRPVPCARAKLPNAGFRFLD